MSITLLSTNSKSLEAEPCTFDQVYITLGDKFSPVLKSKNQFTIGAVSNGDCETSALTLKLIDGPKGSEDLLAPANVVTPYYFSGVDIWKKNASTTYNRTSYFFYVSENDVSSSKGWQLLYQKTPLKKGLWPKKVLDKNKSTKLAIVGDMDLTNEALVTVSALGKLNTDDYDMFMHLGDMAYDIHDDNGTKGDQFFEEMSKQLTTRIPYIITGGNHEWIDEGSFLQYRFRMPGANDLKKRKNFYYSYDVKNTYFVSIDFDYMFISFADNYDQVSKEVFDWLKNDLEAADKRGVKFKVFFSHRPFYCSDIKYASDCSANFWYFRQFEALLLKHNIDLLLQAHVHIYTRSYKFQNWKVDKKDKNGRKGPISLIIGHSGTVHFFPGKKEEPRFDVDFIASVR